MRRWRSPSRVCATVRRESQASRVAGKLTEQVLMPIACVMIFGENPEPFLEAALRSVAWVDYYAIVNTGSGGPAAGENERTVRAAVPSAKLRYAGYESAQFSFADARNLALGL